VERGVQVAPLEGRESGGGNILDGGEGGCVKLDRRSLRCRFSTKMRGTAQKKIHLRKNKKDEKRGMGAH